MALRCGCPRVIVLVFLLDYLANSFLLLAPAVLELARNHIHAAQSLLGQAVEVFINELFEVSVFRFSLEFADDLSVG